MSTPSTPPPDPGDPAKRARWLRDQIWFHNERYYNDDAPVISDGQYDALMQELRDLEAAHPELRSAGSPTQIIGGSASDRFPQVQHPLPMLSLANAFSRDDLEAWHRRVTDLLDGQSFRMVAELKIDGLAVRLVYRDGALRPRRHPRQRPGPARTSPTTCVKSAASPANWSAISRPNWKCAARFTCPWRASSG